MTWSWGAFAIGFACAHVAAFAFFTIVFFRTTRRIRGEQINADFQQLRDVLLDVRRN